MVSLMSLDTVSFHVHAFPYFLHKLDISNIQKLPSNLIEQVENFTPDFIMDHRKNTQKILNYTTTDYLLAMCIRRKVYMKHKWILSCRLWSPTQDSSWFICKYYKTLKPRIFLILRVFNKGCIICTTCQIWLWNIFTWERGRWGECCDIAV